MYNLLPIYFRWHLIGLEFSYIALDGTGDSKARNNFRFFPAAHETGMIHWIFVIVERGQMFVPKYFGT